MKQKMLFYVSISICFMVSQGPHCKHMIVYVPIPFSQATNIADAPTLDLMFAHCKPNAHQYNQGNTTYCWNYPKPAGTFWFLSGQDVLRHKLQFCRDSFNNYGAVILASSFQISMVELGQKIGRDKILPHGVLKCPR